MIGYRVKPYKTRSDSFGYYAQAANFTQQTVKTASSQWQTDSAKFMNDKRSCGWKRKRYS